MTTRTEQDFLLLVQVHQGIIRKVCHLYGRNDADRDDLYQEIVIQLWKAFGSFRGDAKISTWMYRIALNTAISNLRKQSRKVTLSFPEFIPKDEAETYEEKLKEEKLQQMYAAIGRLTEVEKAIVMLYLEDKSYDEMEEILGIGNGALRVKMNRIKEKLRSLTKAEAYGT